MINATGHPPIINPRHVVRQRKKYGLIQRICVSDNQIRSFVTAPSCAAIESTNLPIRKQFNRS